MEYTVNYGKDLKREVKTDDLEKALRVCKNCFIRGDVIYNFSVYSTNDELLSCIELPENMEQLKAEIEKVTADAPKINNGKRKEQEQADSDLPDL